MWISILDLAPEEHATQALGTPAASSPDPISGSSEPRFRPPARTRRDRPSSGVLLLNLYARDVHIDTHAGRPRT
jgi:hypothetical protein